MFTVLFTAALAASAMAAPTANKKRNLEVRQAGDCTQSTINFDAEELNGLDLSTFTPVPEGFAGFAWPDFFLTSCPGDACRSFPAETTAQFTGPRLAMTQGLVGGLITGRVLLETTSSAEFNLQDANGSFDLGAFDVFDIIDLPEEVKLGAEQDMRVHLDCGKAGTDERITKTIPFPRNRDSAGYSVAAGEVADFTGLSGCKISTTQVFFPGGFFELEIPTESMGLDNLNVCIR